MIINFVPYVPFTQQDYVDYIVKLKEENESLTKQLNEINKSNATWEELNCFMNKCGCLEIDLFEANGRIKDLEKLCYSVNAINRIKQLEKQLDEANARIKGFENNYQQECAHDFNHICEEKKEGFGVSTRHFIKCKKCGLKNELIPV
jgi:predicted  nucleic acid-binding Zn-ribbon protein